MQRDCVYVGDWPELLISLLKHVTHELKIVDCDQHAATIFEQTD